MPGDYHPFGGRVSKHFGHSLAPDEAYLSYYDTRLYKDDITSLKNDWLTDNIISFWEEYLEHEFLTEYKSSNIVLLRPTMSYMLLSTEQPTSLKSALPDFASTTHIFLPIIDQHYPGDSGGGTHWSLLLVSVADGVAFHYDSLTNLNKPDAYRVTQKLSTLLGKPLSFINLDDSPMQENNSDCGVFVCLNMRHLLLKRLLQARADEKINMSMSGRKVDAKEGRKEILRIIEDFRKEGERRRSRSASPHPKKSRSPPRIDSPIKASPVR